MILSIDVCLDPMPMRVAFIGPEGTYGERAARSLMRLEAIEKPEHFQNHPYQKLKEDLLYHCSTLTVFSFNGGRYDCILTSSFLLSYLFKERLDARDTGKVNLLNRTAFASLEDEEEEEEEEEEEVYLGGEEEEEEEGGEVLDIIQGEAKLRRADI